MKKNYRAIIVLIIIVLFGSFFRFFHIDYQLPGLYLPDEEFFVDPALRIANGNLNPGWYGAPGQTIIYAMGIGFRIISFILNTIRGTDLPAVVNYQENFNLFYACARSLFAVLGSLSIVAVYFLVKFWNKRTALISAFLVASSFYLIDHSHIIRPDIPQTFFLLLLLVFLFKIIDHPQKTIWYILSGVSFAAAITTKYPALFFLPVIIACIVWLIIKKDFIFKKWFSFGITTVLTLFLTGPFLFISFKNALKQVGLENATSHGIQGGLGFGGNLWWYLFNTLNWEMGTFLYLLAIITVFVLFYRIYRKRLDDRTIKMLMIAMTAIIYILALSFLNLHWERWLIPALTLLFIPSAVAIDYLFNTLKSKLLLSVIIIILLIGPGLRLTRTVYGYSHAYTIEQAKTWMQENIPTQSTIIREPYTPELSKNDYRIINVPNLGWDNIVADYSENKPFYFAISESVYGVILKRAEIKGEDKSQSAIENYNNLISNSKLLFEINPNNSYSTEELINRNDISIINNFTSQLYMGPYIRIYEFNPSN
ncbi:MAG: glycosyltransferase family 39 protein [Patescibacteria group bacterium]